MHSGRFSFFAAASWLVPVLVIIVGVHLCNEFTATETARGHVSWGAPPGIDRLFIGLLVAAGLAFSLGLVSYLRSERLRWVAAIPFLAGGLFLWWVGTAALGNLIIPAARSGRLSPDLIMGILLAVVGVVFLEWHGVRQIICD